MGNDHTCGASLGVAPTSKGQQRDWARQPGQASAAHFPQPPRPKHPAASATPPPSQLSPPRPVVSGPTQ